MKRTFILTLICMCIILICSIGAHAADNKGAKTFGIFGNYNMPRSDLDEAFDSSFSGGIKIGYGITKEIGTEFAFSVHNFDGEKGVDDLSFDCLRLNLFYRFDTTTNLYPFFTFGVGYYMPDEGDDNDPGINFGLGFITELIDINDMFNVDFSGNYHQIFNDGKDTTFFELRLGLNFGFY